jgi:hypothetical protein
MRLNPFAAGAQKCLQQLARNVRGTDPTLANSSSTPTTSARPQEHARTRFTTLALARRQGNFLRQQRTPHFAGEPQRKTGTAAPVAATIVHDFPCFPLASQYPRP